MKAVCKLFITVLFIAVLASQSFTAQAVVNQGEILISGTNATFSTTVTLSEGEAGLGELELYLSGEKVWEKSFLPPTAPGYLLAVDQTVNVRVDSTHWAHGTQVEVRWAVKTYSGTRPNFVLDDDWQIVLCPETPEVYNRALIAVDTSAEFAGLAYGPSANGLYSGMNYSTSGMLNSRTWTRDDFLAELFWATSTDVLAHGQRDNSGAGYMIPPGGGGDVTGELVFECRSDAYFFGLPPIWGAMNLNCLLGNDLFYLASYLVPSWPENQFSWGYKISVNNIVAQGTSIMFLQLQSAGHAAKKALQLAHAFFSDPDEFGNHMEYVGDPSHRLKWLYGGNPDDYSQYGIWYLVTPQ